MYLGRQTLKIENESMDFFLPARAGPSRAGSACRESARASGLVPHPAGDVPRQETRVVSGRIAHGPCSGVRRFASLLPFVPLARLLSLHGAPRFQREPTQGGLSRFRASSSASFISRARGLSRPRLERSHRARLVGIFLWRGTNRGR